MLKKKTVQTLGLIAALFVIVTGLLPGRLYSSAKQTPSYAIHIVFDNSASTLADNSLVMEKYAVELFSAFAFMKNAQLELYSLNGIVYSYHSYQDAAYMLDTVMVEGGTPATAVVDAAESLIKKNVQEKWLVVFLQGKFENYDAKQTVISESTLFQDLDGIISQGGNVVFVSIGTEESYTFDTDNAHLHQMRLTDPDLVSETVSELSELIFGRKPGVVAADRSITVPSEADSLWFLAESDNAADEFDDIYLCRENDNGPVHTDWSTDTICGWDNIAVLTENASSVYAKVLFYESPEEGKYILQNVPDGCKIYAAYGGESAADIGETPTFETISTPEKKKAGTTVKILLVIAAAAAVLAVGLLLLLLEIKRNSANSFRSDRLYRILRPLYIIDNVRKKRAAASVSAEQKTVSDSEVPTTDGNESVTVTVQAKTEPVSEQKNDGFIFLSYSQKDVEKADAIRSLLIAQGYRVWMSKYDIEPGKLFAECIDYAIIECRCMLLLLSENAMNSQNIINEIHIAHDERKTIIVLMLEDFKLSGAFRYYLESHEMCKLKSSISLQDPGIKHLLYGIRGVFK